MDSRIIIQMIKEKESVCRSTDVKDQGKEEKLSKRERQRRCIIGLEDEVPATQPLV